MTLSLIHFLIVSTLLFGAGVMTVTLKRNAIGILMGVELILNAANLNLVAFNVYGKHSPAHILDGQIFTLFVIVLAAAEAAVALAIILNFFNNASTIDVERANRLKG